MIDKSEYKNIEIPENLRSVVRNAIDDGLCAKHTSARNRMLRRTALAACFALCFITLLNVSPVFAETTYGIPVIGDVCRIFTFHEYHLTDEIKYIDAEIPRIDNTGKSELEQRLNLEIQKIVNDRLIESETIAKEYYDAFVETGGNPDDFIPVGITIDYDIKHISPDYASFVIFQYETAFSAYNYSYYYNVDMENGYILTLKDWFGDDYREIVADSIETTIATTWSDEQKGLLWDDLSIINLISENTDFYINEDNQAVVVIDKYEAAAGAAGALEFVIQTPAN